MTEVSHASDEKLAALSHVRRRDYMTALNTVANQADNPFIDKDAITEGLQRLLATTPYPADAETRDRHVAERFYKAWKKAGDGGNDPRKIFIRDCWLAAGAMGLNPRTLDLRVRRQQASLAKSNHDFSYIATAKTDTDKKPPRLNVKLYNSPESDIWTARRPSEDVRTEIAGYALHEVTHAEQVINGKDKQRAPLYETIAFQAFAVTGSEKVPVLTYYSKMEERQAYLRQRAFESLARGEPIQSEKAYLTASLEAEAPDLLSIRAAAALNHEKPELRA